MKDNKRKGVSQFKTGRAGLFVRNERSSVEGKRPRGFQQDREVPNRSKIGVLQHSLVHPIRVDPSTHCR